MIKFFFVGGLVYIVSRHKTTTNIYFRRINLKLKNIAATLSLIAIEGSSITAAAKVVETATGTFKGWTTVWGAGKVHSEYTDDSHDWWKASVKNGNGEYAVNYKYAGADDGDIAKAKEDAIFNKADYSYYDMANYDRKCDVLDCECQIKGDKSE